MSAAEITDKLGLHSLRQRAWVCYAPGPPPLLATSRRDSVANLSSSSNPPAPLRATVSTRVLSGSPPLSATRSATSKGGYEDPRYEEHDSPLPSLSGYGCNLRRRPEKNNRIVISIAFSPSIPRAPPNLLGSSCGPCFPHPLAFFHPLLSQNKNVPVAGCSWRCEVLPFASTCPPLCHV